MSDRKAVSLPTWLAGLQWLNVKDFGAKGDGKTDDSAAINAADIQALGGGAVGIDTKTVTAKGGVYFPPGVYAVKETLTYRGAPWYGEGRHASIIDFRGRGAAIDAVGTDAARRVVRITDLLVRGAQASPGSIGIRLGFNHRSFGALERVHLRDFPSYGIYLAADNWLLSFSDVFIEHCGHAGTAGLGMGHVSDLNAFDWFNLTIEDCGKTGSGVGGGIHLDAKNGVRGWKFHGGSWEGNHGAAEAVFLGCQQVALFGVYSESATDSVVDGYVFEDSHFVVTGGYAAGAPKTEGKGIRVSGKSRGTVTGCMIDQRWGAPVSIEGESVVVVDGERKIAAP